MPRATTIVTSIMKGGKASPENVTIDSVSWSTDNGTITLASDPGDSVKNGDVITHTGSGNKYLIISQSGAVMTCNEFNTTTDPTTGAATINVAYNSMTDWEADLDAGTNSEVYKSGDTAIGECYDDGGNFDESVTVNQGGTIGLVSATITAAVDERHTGIAGTGARIVRTANHAHLICLDTPTDMDLVCSWLELDANSKGSGTDMIGLGRVGSSSNGSAGKSAEFQNCLAHHTDSNQRKAGFGTQNASSSSTFTSRFLNCIAYRIKKTSGGGSDQASIFFKDTSTPAVDFLNCTGHHAESFGTGGAFCFEESTTGGTVQTKNCIGTDPDQGSGSGTEECFDAALTGQSFNLSSDATASGTGSLTNKASADQFVSTTDGSEDLHLKAGADAIDAGTDLGTTPAGVEIDIDNRDRDAQGDVWDMGADELVAAPASDGGVSRTRRQQLMLLTR